MDNNNVEEDQIYRYQKTESNKIHTHNNCLKNRLEENFGFRTKNIILSLPKLNKGGNRINKSFLRTLNLTIKNKRNKSIDSMSPEKNPKYDSTTQTFPKKDKKNSINISIINKDKEYYYPETNKFTLIFEKSQSNQIHQKKIVKKIYNTTYKSHIKKKIKLKDSQKKEPITNKSIDQKPFNTQNIYTFIKKPSVDYITPILKNMRTYIVREEPNLKLLNVGDLMNWKIKNKYIKNDFESKLGGMNLKSYFKVGSKFSSGEKIKDLEQRNEYYKKIQLLNEENKEMKESREKKKIVPLRNFRDVLEFYKNNRFDNCRRLIKQTLIDVKKEKNTIVEFFENYKKVFDEFDDWNDPKNKDNLYN